MARRTPLIAGVADVSCSGVCVAVGSNGVGPASISSPDQGRTWTAGGAPVGIAAIASLSCGSTGACVAVGSESTTSQLDGAASWTSDGGHTWSASTMPSGILPVPSVVSCRGQLCAAVGTYSRSIGPPIILSELVVSTDGGRTWTKRTAPNTFYATVECTDAQHCLALAYLVGTGAVTAMTDDGGATWTNRASNLTTSGALSCADRLTCWTVGPPGNSSPTAAVTTDGGVTWTPQTVPGRPGASAVYGGLADIDCPTTTTCVAVGNDNNVPEEIVNTHDGGTTWIRRSTPVSVPSQPGAVACAPGSATCWATEGTMLLGTNDARHWRTVPIDDYVEGITCVDAEHCWAVGSGIWGTSDGGTTWVKQSDTRAEPLTDVSCTDALHCWTVGFGPTGFVGILQHTEDGGAHWAERPLPNGMIPLDIVCTGTAHCVAVDPSSAHVTDDGGVTWSTHSLSAGLQDVADLTCTDQAHCWVVGDGGIGFSGDGGETWATQTTTTDVRYPDGIACIDALRCVAAGQSLSGATPTAIVGTIDGGQTWTPQASPAAINAINGVACSTLVGCVGAVGVGDRITANLGAGIIRMRPPRR
jgi:photosystem II stability/assembly factor-like uncharacterized protein